jgi:curved DNA-binding protein CbpA
MSSLLDEEQNYYELLEVRKDATPAEIRSAYVRARASWKKDNVAFYSIFSEEDTERLLRRIEEAYQTLSHPERRREYDRTHGLQNPAATKSNASDFSSLFGLGKAKGAKAGATADPFAPPPMDELISESDLLIPPSTDFSPTPLLTKTTSQAESTSGREATPTPEANQKRSPILDSIAKNQFVSSASPSGLISNDSQNPADHLPPPPPTDHEWRGQTLRRSRESQGVTLEELAAYTKIGKNYITAIEEEHLDKLPAPVFLRGFLMTIARRLKLPQEQVATAWMERLRNQQVK